MQPGARIQAAIDILCDVLSSKRPVDRVLKDWGRANRYAGSRDRREIGAMVYDAFRFKASFAAAMGSDDPRALVLARQVFEAKTDIEDLAQICSGEAYNAAPLSGAERAALSHPLAVDNVARVNVPAWMLEKVIPQFDPAQSLGAMTARAPLDLRVNVSRGTRKDMLSSLMSAVEDLSPQARPDVSPATLSPWGIRLWPSDPARPAFQMQGYAPYEEGTLEIQDEGSQLVSLLLGAEPRMTVIDLCAGAGGKSLAMAMTMENRGRILACDVEAPKLRECAARAARAGASIVETGRLDPHGESPALTEWEGKADLVVLDVPCSGSGTWRRQPEAKWLLSPERLDELTQIQAQILARGAKLVRPGGRLAYITCSLFEAENTAQIARFVAENPGFRQIPLEGVAEGLPEACKAGDALQLAPHLSQTDGFYCAMMARGT